MHRSTVAGIREITELYVTAEPADQPLGIAVSAKYIETSVVIVSAPERRHSSEKMRLAPLTRGCSMSLFIPMERSGRMKQHGDCTRSMSRFFI